MDVRFRGSAHVCIFSRYYVVHVSENILCVHTSTYFSLVSCISAFTADRTHTYTHSAILLLFVPFLFVSVCMCSLATPQSTPVWPLAASHVRARIDVRFLNAGYCYAWYVEDRQDQSKTQEGKRERQVMAPSFSSAMSCFTL